MISVPNYIIDNLIERIPKVMSLVDAGCLSNKDANNMRLVNQSLKKLRKLKERNK